MPVSKALNSAPYMAHFIVEGVNQRAAALKAARLRELMLVDGAEISNTVPAVVRGMPFAPLFNTLGPQGERWVPLHGYLPHSKVGAFHDAVEALFDARAAAMRRLGVWRGGMFMTVGSTAFLYEIALYWPGTPSAYHRAAVPADYLAKLPPSAESPEADAFVDELKRDLIELYTRFGASAFSAGQGVPLCQRVLAGERGIDTRDQRVARSVGLDESGGIGIMSRLSMWAYFISGMTLSFAALAQEPGDASGGKRLFLQCQACHSLQSDTRGLIGPSLMGVIGRPAASLPGYAYSPALTASKLTWNEATLDQWLEHPNALVPNTKMIFAGVANAADRSAIIAYLKSAAGTAPVKP